MLVLCLLLPFGKRRRWRNLFGHGHSGRSTVEGRLRSITSSCSIPPLSLSCSTFVHRQEVPQDCSLLLSIAFNSNIDFDAIIILRYTYLLPFQPRPRVMSQQIPIVNDGNVVENGDLKVNGHHTSKFDSAQPSESYVLHRTLHHDPQQVTFSKGHYLHLSNGQKIFDATGGAAVACLGHGDDRYLHGLLTGCSL